MNKKTIEGLLNPVRMKIAMLFLDHSLHTIGDIKKTVTDIPSASLYRHINRLVDDGIITVVSETKKRGAIEKTYQLKTNPFEEMNQIGIDGTSEDKKELFYVFAMTLVMEFNNYMKDDKVDMVKDSVGYRSFPLNVSDQENEEFLDEFRALIGKYINNEANDERTLRKFSFVYAPGDNK